VGRKHADEFPLVIWQTGSGTQSNMNMNEVLANRASELLGGPRGEGASSTPTTTSTWAVVQRRLPHRHARGRGRGRPQTRPSVREGPARHAAEEVRRVPRHREDRPHAPAGRDARSPSGQEISGYVSQLDHGLDHLEAALPHLCELALGEPPSGTGLNAHPEFGVRVAKKLAELWDIPS
jgi:fumarate hydratase class II